MGYSITILKRAKKELAELPKQEYERIRDSILELADNPRPSGSLKLSGRTGYRIRCGDYRVIYEVHDERAKLTVLHIGHIAFFQAHINRIAPSPMPLS